MKLKTIIEDDFIKAVETIAKADVSVDAAYKLLDIKEKVIGATEKFLTLRKTLLERYGQRSEDGKLMADYVKGEYLIKDQKGFDKAYADLLNLEITIPSISRNDLKDVKISAELLKPLRAIITD